MTPIRILAAVLLAFLALDALAQRGAAVIVGRVTTAGQPLSGAMVRVDSDVIQNPRVTRTTRRGTYWSAILPPGTYRITFSHPGMQTVTRKAEVRVAETIRVDAELEPSDEGDSVERTAITRSIMERPHIETPIGPEIVDGLPMARELESRAALAPSILGRAIRGSAENLFVIDGVAMVRRGSPIEIEEAIDDAAVISATTSPEYGRYSGGVILATTRGGSNTLSASFRETITRATWLGSGVRDDRVRGRSEATVGGPIVPDSFWFFLAGQYGSDAALGSERSGLAKMHASPGPIVTLSGNVLRSAVADETRAGGDIMALVSRRAVIDARAGTYRIGGRRERHQSITLHTLVPTRWGDHAFVAGGEQFEESSSVFAGDSWSDGVRWVLSAGVRYDEDLGTFPRLGVAYDLHGDGKARFGASWSEYAGLSDIARESVLSYSQRLFGSGYFRAAFVNRNYDRLRTYRALEAELRGDYLLFGFGGSMAVRQEETSGLVWVTANPPALEHRLSAAMVLRMRKALATDIALEYHFSRMRIEPFAKLDLMNVFDRPLSISEDPLGERRAVRIILGARL